MVKKKSDKESTWGEIGKAIGAKIENECKDGECNSHCVNEKVHCHGSGGALYGLGFIGSLVYFLSTATDIWAGILGFLKALVWPAFLAYGALKFLGL